MTSPVASIAIQRTNYAMSDRTLEKLNQPLLTSASEPSKVVHGCERLPRNAMTRTDAKVHTPDRLANAYDMRN